MKSPPKTTCLQKHTNCFGSWRSLYCWLSVDLILTTLTTVIVFDGTVMQWKRPTVLLTSLASGCLVLSFLGTCRTLNSLKTSSKHLQLKRSSSSGRQSEALSRTSGWFVALQSILRQSPHFQRLEPLETKKMYRLAKERVCTETLDFLVAIETAKKFEVELLETYLLDSSPKQVNVSSELKNRLLLALETFRSVQQEAKKEMTSLLFKNQL